MVEAPITNLEVPEYIPNNKIVDLVEYLYIYATCPYCHKNDWDPDLTTQDYYDHILQCVKYLEKSKHNNA